MEYATRQAIRKLLLECDPLHMDIAVMFGKGGRDKNESTDFYWNDILCLWADQFGEEE